MSSSQMSKTLPTKSLLDVKTEETEIKRFKIIIEYDGTNYVGWQRQPGLKSIQGEIEAAIFKFCGQETYVYGSGRTDAGVHAMGQVAHFDLVLPVSWGKNEEEGERRTDSEKACYKVSRALNHYLQDQPIRILKTERVTDDFHARFSATGRQYLYRLISRPQPLALEKNRAAYVWYPLNLETMQTAAQHLIGKHDFSAFRATACQSKSPIKTLSEIKIAKQGDLFTFYFKAPSFLHHQVRNMVGSLCLVGQGQWTPDDLQACLLAKNRVNAGPTAKACGLYFIQADYGRMPNDENE